MRRRSAQIAILLGAFFLGLPPLLHPQQTAATDIPDVQAFCPPASHDEESPGPQISIAEVSFSGTLQLATSDQDQIAASIKQQNYGNSPAGVTDEALERARAGWQDHGYFKVQVNGDARTLTSSPVSQRIALMVHVDEGLQYSLGEVTFKHNKAIRSFEALRTLFPIKDGDIFSREKTAIGLENLRKAYGQMGYINFTSVPDTKLDDENKLIRLAIDVEEGKQFYVSSVNVEGLDEPSRQELLRDLPIKPRQIHSSRLWGLSLLKHASMFPECECRDYQSLRLDEQTGTVAVTLDFRPCSAQ